MKSETFMMTVVGKDRPGIIERVTGVLYRHGCSLEDVSMTILEGEFAMMLLHSLKNKKVKLAIAKEMSRLEQTWDLSVYWKRLKGKRVRGEAHPRNCETYMVSAVGRDRTGIVHRVSKLLAKSRLNITDLNSRILGRGSKTIYTMFLEVDIPRRFRLQKLQKGLSRLQSDLGVELKIRPVERIEF